MDLGLSSCWDSSQQEQHQVSSISATQFETESLTELDSTGQMDVDEQVQDTMNPEKKSEENDDVFDFSDHRESQGAPISTTQPLGIDLQVDGLSAGDNPQLTRGFALPQPVDLSNPFGETLTLEQQAKRGLKVSTADYDAEFKRFIKWVDEYGKGVTKDDVLESRLSSSGMDYLMADYLGKRFNLTVLRQVITSTKFVHSTNLIMQEGIAVRVDPNTLGPLVSRLTSMIEQKTDYR